MSNRYDLNKLSRSWIFFFFETRFFYGFWVKKKNLICFCLNLGEVAKFVDIRT